VTYRSNFSGKRALVTGGLGFIGSNLAIRLVELGASVSIVDSSVTGCGANLRNVAAIRDRIQIIPLDIANAAEFQDDIRSADVIFNLAGEISHARSMRMPERDMALNVTAQLRFLDVCRRVRPGIRIVFAGTRQVYGRPLRLPVDEGHPLEPIDFNGIHKLAAAQYHLLLSNRGELDAAIIRLTNVYGPRMALRFSWQGFIAVYIRAALLGEPLLAYGDGRQLRDPVFVDDAVNAFLAAAAVTKLPSRVYNVGGAEPLPVSSIAAHFADAGGSAVHYVPYPDGGKAIDIGSYRADWTRIFRELGWHPEVALEEGCRRTLDYYRRCQSHYIDPPAAPLPRGPRHVQTLEPAATQ
jgi:UDP-glucose 4-epimerase